MSIKVKVSPIYYMGNKRRLIARGLVELFPSDIGGFYDLFGGSGVVSLNTNANQYVLNELDNNVFGMYQNIKNNDPRVIINHIENRIDEFELPRKSTHSKNTTKDERDYYKKRYMRFREYYNANRNPLDLFVLMNYCMSQTMRFNQSGGFNMPFGSDRFIKENHSVRYYDFHEFLNKKETKITNKSYLEFNTSDYNDSDFIYLDPPYMNTIATYNENGKWDNEDQEELLKYCLELDRKGIRFAMSNIFKNRSFYNENLIDWCKNNNFNVYDFKGFSYSNFGKASSDSREVLITNYKTGIGGDVSGK